jgi:hypothetical protein
VVACAEGVDADRRLLLVVLAPVDEDLAPPVHLGHLRDDLLRGLLLEQLSDRLGERPGLLVGHLRIEREIDLHPLAARDLREALHAECPEELPDTQRHLAALAQARRRTGIEVEDEHGRLLHPHRPGERGVELQGSKLRHPDQRRAVLAEAEVDLTGATVDVDRRRLHPVRAVLGAVLLEERGVRFADAFGEAAQGQGAGLQVRNDQIRDPGVVVDHLRLGGLRLRVEDLVQVRQLQPAVADRDLLVPLLGLGGQPRPLGLGLLARGALPAPVGGRAL